MSTSTSSRPIKLFHSSSEEETFSVARSLGSHLRGGDWVALVGELGAGKTVFAQGLAEGLGCRDVPSSATFPLAQVHGPKAGKKWPLRHVDLYRLPACDVPALGWEELLDKEGVTVVEWAEKSKGLWPSDVVEVRFALDGENRRTLSFFGGGRAQELVRKVGVKS